MNTETIALLFLAAFPLVTTPIAWHVGIERGKQIAAQPTGRTAPCPQGQPTPTTASSTWSPSTAS